MTRLDPARVTPREWVEERAREYRRMAWAGQGKVMLLMSIEAEILMLGQLIRERMQNRSIR